MTLIWVTGNAGVGKSTACTLLRHRDELITIDADQEGYSRWVGRATAQVVVDPPYPVPAGWLDHHAWQINRAQVEALARHTHGRTAVLFGSAENESDVRDLFDLVICLVVDTETLRERLRTRTTNAFGQRPEELAAALDANDHVESRYRRLGATIVDAEQAPPRVADAILAVTARLHTG
jgi:NAD(P)-dependent dehydrogenase (short-subunit alcohol dehydrogenase family)